MKRKWLIYGGGILLSVFLIFLILIGGASTTENIPTEETLTQIVSGVTCQIDGEDDLSYDISTLTNNIQFDSEIKQKKYKKILINHSQKFESLGVAFILKTSSDDTINCELYKNEEVIKTFSSEVKTGELLNVNLVMKEAIEINATDNYYIKISSTSDFVFDTTLFFIQEV